MMVEIQKGLFLEARSFVVNGVVHYNSRLNSADGYCFYDRTEKYFDNESNLITDIKDTDRAYMTKNIVPMTSIEQLNDIFVSVSIKEGFSI